jgi:anion-transporting  ArsA/GET3 family ATPase
MAISETRRLLNDLNKFEIIPQQIIINNVMVSDGCDFCKQRKLSQLPHLHEISNSFSTLNKVEVQMFAREIKGLDTLNQLRNCLFNDITSNN